MDADVIIVGGGPAGSTLASLLALSGHRAILLERDIHPRNHVGESLTGSVNVVLNEIGFLDKVEDAGFVHKHGVGWTAPRARLGNFIAIPLAEFPLPNAIHPYSYNVERDEFDAMLLRHAHELGAKVLQGVTVRKVLFDGDRAVGVRASATDGWTRDLRAPVVVDASGRRCLLATQLRLKKKDPELSQFSMWSWFRGLKERPPEHVGYVVFHFLDLERAWAWDIPMRNGVTSVGVVTDKADFNPSGRSHEEFFADLAGRNLTFRQVMSDARRIRPWVIEGDYSYRMDTFAGSGWLLVGDACRFVDPVFSSGVDVAVYSAKFAHEAIVESLSGGDEAAAFARYQGRVSDGVDVWHEMTLMFYRLQVLFTWFALKREHRGELVQALRGNPYLTESQIVARRLSSQMHALHDDVIQNPKSLLRPGALRGPIEPARPGR
jgi:1H-pyrrole-2-carbonyl-[peptidyl-carrier protein] chlorinase